MMVVWPSALMDLVIFRVSDSRPSNSFMLDPISMSTQSGGCTLVCDEYCNAQVAMSSKCFISL